MTGTILAIDLGTSSIKLLAVDRQGEVVGRVKILHDTLQPVPGAAEQDVSLWWHTLGNGVQHLSAELADGVDAIAVTGQMHGLVVHDEDGEVVRPAITWQDRRSEMTLPRLLDTVRDCPIAISPGYQAASWHWLTQHEPDRARRARRLLLPKDEIILRLTGQSVTDPSDAVGTGWFDPFRGTWDPAIIRAAGASTEVLPRIIPSGSVAGPLTAAAALHLGVARGTPVIIAGGDAAVGAFGAGATEPDSPLLMLSTGCQVLLPCNLPQDPDRGGWQLWPAATTPGLSPWLKAGATLNGGGTIGWARATFGGEATDGDTLLSRESDPIFVPYLAGERFPTERSGSTGALFGLGRQHDRAAMLRSAITGVAMATADALVTMGGDISTDTPLLVGGGGVRDDAWVAAILHAFDRPLRVVTEPDLSAWGAARLAAAQLGWIDPVADPGGWRPALRSIDRPKGQTGDAATRLARYRHHARLIPDPATGVKS